MHFGKRWPRHDGGGRGGVVSFQANRNDIELIAPAGAVAKLAAGRYFEPVEFKTLDVYCHVRFTGNVDATSLVMAQWLPGGYSLLRGPTLLTSIDLNPILNAGDSGFIEKSPCSGS